VISYALNISFDVSKVSESKYEWQPLLLKLLHNNATVGLNPLKLL